MKFNYKNQEYELLEMVEPYKPLTSGLLVILKVTYVIIDSNYNEIDVGKNNDYEFESYEYINYFCNQDDVSENIKIAKEYIDEYLERMAKPHEN